MTLVALALAGHLVQSPAATLRIRVLEPGDVPAVDAVVTLGARSVRADADGRTVVEVAPGAVVLRIGKLGFRGWSERITLRAGQDTSLTVRLEPEGETIEELVVTATRIPRRVEDQPLRVEVLGTEEVEEKLLMTPGDVTMLLNETGGLRVQTTSPSLGGANVRIQGLRGRYTRLLSDGLPLYGGQTGGLGLLQVPPMDLGQVEIIKGAASALFGAAALGGVVNLVSRRPAPASQLLLNGTSLGGSDAVAFLGREWSEAWGATLLAGYHRQGRTDRDGDGWTDVPGYDRIVLRPRIFRRSGRGGSLFFTGGLTHEGRDGGTLPGRVAPDGAPFPERLRTTRFDGGLVAVVPLSGGVSLQARASGVTQRHDHRFGTVAERDRHATGFAEAAVTGRLGGTDWLAGLGLEADRYRSEAFPIFDADDLSVGLFVQAERDLSPRWSLATSARLDRHDEYGTFLSPRASLLARMGAGWRIRGSIGGGFFAPTVFTEETEVTGLSRVVPLSGLRAERAWTASLDASGPAGPAELGAVLFGSRVERPLLRRPLASDPSFVELVNADGPARALGLELLARYRVEPVMVTASYVYTAAREVGPDGRRRDVPLTPRHSAGVVAVWEAEGKSRIGVELYYTGRQALEENPYRPRSRPYLIAGVLGERRVGRARFFLNLENLGDARQTRYDPLVRPVRAPDGRWTTDAWAPLEGRVVNGGVRLDL
ncbi:MAG TPA: TonB-dependent receptor [Gemmatimonadales bacterium]|nr:TonB-dependent receptor [Gemmatimonadales bacterium]